MMKENMSNSEESLIKPKTLEEVRAMIKSHKRMTLSSHPWVY